LDSSGPRLVRVEPDAVQGFGQVTVSVVDLHQTGLVELQGLAFDPTSGRLHAASPTEQKLYELTQSGQTVAYRDLSEFDLSNPQGMVFAASGDLTDDPSQLSLYLADSGLSGGQIVELSFAQPLQLITIAADIEATLVQTTATSLYASPSPDPAGVAYLNSTGTLLISDSEVNEIPALFQGANLFETTLAGTLIVTSTTTGWSPINSKEPTGAAYKSDPNLANARLFISDDNKKEVFVAAAGADGRYGTPDDSVNTFDTSVFGSNDPEGIAYDSWQDVLYLSDGVNNEVYRVDPGSNGVFDGVDDQVTSFDVSSFVTDPEGITFDPNNGHLYIVGDSAVIAEISNTGNLLRTIGIAAANALNAGGLAYAPSSANPGQMNIYIVYRGIDNNSDPNENDGVLIEMSFPPLAPAPPVAVNDNPNVFEDTPTAIDVASNDSDPDGIVDPTTANTTCPTCSVPTHGGLTNNGDGTFEYSPNQDYFGPDSFVYEICDITIPTPLCDTATVNITVGGSNVYLPVILR
ncbi:MAG: Ig-like domain-containing protein, partial [Anaerolineae bacterium]|nr:Ig-like domain-containing protein [Anaerolineae bacterium]